MAVKHIVIAKFKDEISQEKIDELIKGYANLVNLIPPMKSFHWYGTSFIHYLLLFQFNYPLRSAHISSLSLQITN